MDNEFIYDRYGKPIAMLIHRMDGTGTIAIHTKDGVLLGWYNPYSNQTFSRNGVLVGHGNLLGTLIRI